MGGSAYIIPGTLSAERGAAAAEAAPLLKRLLGRRTARAPRVSVLGTGDQLIDVDPGVLRPVVGDFQAWVRSSIPEPSKGTKAPLQYLEDIQPTIYVRGLQRRRSRAQWNVQLSFSGCAGEAETSARVATHWAAL